MWTEFCHFLTPLSVQFLYPEHGQKQIYFDPLSLSFANKQFSVTQQSSIFFKRNVGIPNCKIAKKHHANYENMQVLLFFQMKFSNLVHSVYNTAKMQYVLYRAKKLWYLHNEPSWYSGKHSRLASWVSQVRTLVGTVNFFFFFLSF